MNDINDSPKRRQDDLIPNVQQQSASQKLGMSLLTWGIIILAVLSVGAIFQRYETSLFPVVTDFTVTSLERSENGLLVSGTMNKRRACEFLEITAYTYPDNDKFAIPTRVTFYDDMVETRSAISQRWGPWSLHIPYEFEEVRVSVHSRHQCNLLYQTHSHLTDFTITNHNDQLMMRR